jgi:hypothetical protein
VDPRIQSRGREILEVRAGCGKETAGAMQLVPHQAHDASADAVHAEVVRIFFNVGVSNCIDLVIVFLY